MHQMIKTVSLAGWAFVVVLTALVTGPPPTSAQEAGGSSLRLVGFSKSGKYLAITRVSSEGAGTVRFLNVPKNSFVARPLWAMDTAKVDSLFNRFKVIRGNKGFNPDIYGYPHPQSIYSVSFEAKNGKSYYLSLKLRNASRGKKCRKFKQTKIFTLELENEKSKVTVLQRDRKLYKARKCPFDYIFKDVYLYKKYIVVFIKSSIPGGNGKRTRDLIVTGTLN